MRYPLSMYMVIEYIDLRIHSVSDYICSTIAAIITSSQSACLPSILESAEFMRRHDGAKTRHILPHHSRLQTSPHFLSFCDDVM